MASARSVMPMLVEAEREKGSVIRGMLHRRRRSRASGNQRARAQGITFRGGLDRLAHRLAEVLGERVRTNAGVVAIRDSGGACEVSLQGGEVIAVERVVVATEPHIAASLVRWMPGAETVAEDLRSIPAADIAVVGLAFRRSQVRHPLDGFGYLVGPGNSGPVLGCLFRSSIFPHTAPAGSVLLTCFLGGAVHGIRGSTDGELVARARRSLGETLGIEGDPVKTFSVRWVGGLSQFNRGHALKRERVERWSAGGRVSIISSGVLGAPLPRCIEAGRAEAQRLAGLLAPDGAGSKERICVPA